MNVSTGDYIILKPLDEIMRTSDYCNFGFNDTMRDTVRRGKVCKISDVYTLCGHTVFGISGSDYNWSPDWVAKNLGRDLDGFAL